MESRDKPTRLLKKQEDNRRSSRKNTSVESPSESLAAFVAVYDRNCYIGTMEVDPDNMDALKACRLSLRDQHKVNAYGPYPGDEAGWEWLSVPHWGWHIHRRPAEGGGSLWLAYDTPESSMGEVGPNRGQLVATCHTSEDGVVLGEWTHL